MPRKPQKFFFHEKRKVVEARFHELKAPGKHPPRVIICDFDELYYKHTERGKVRRSEVECGNYLSQLYNKKLFELQSEKQEAQKEVRSSPMIHHVMQQWIDHVSKFRSARTVETYLISVNYYINIVGDHPIAQYKRHYSHDLQAAFTEKKLSPATQKKHLVHLQSFFNWAYDEEYIEKVVKIDKPRVTKRDPNIYSIQDIDSIEILIREKLANSKNEYDHRCRLNHLRAFIMFINTIMRRGEVFHLPLKNIKLNERIIVLKEVKEVGWNPKNRVEAQIPISEDLARYLSQDLSKRGPKEKWYLDNGKGELIYWDEDQLSKSIKRYCKELNISDVKPIHGIRATGVTRLLELGEDISIVKKLARHADISTTMSYVKNEKLATKKAVDLLNNATITP